MDAGFALHSLAKVRSSFEQGRKGQVVLMARALADTVVAAAAVDHCHSRMQHYGRWKVPWMAQSG